MNRYAVKVSVEILMEVEGASAIEATAAARDLMPGLARDLLEASRISKREFRLAGVHGYMPVGKGFSLS